MDAGQGLGPGHRIVEAAHLVDEPEFLGLGPRPDMSFCDLTDAIDRQLAARRHPGDEVVVDPVHPVGEGRALLGREFRTHTEPACIGSANAHLAHIHAKARQRGAQGELAAEHADRTGEGCRLGNDGRSLGRDPIAAGGAVGSHRDDHRLAGRLGGPDRAEDLLGGRVGPAGRVQPEHHGLHVLRLDRVIEGAGDVVGMDGCAAPERIGAGVLARYDIALALDDSDGGTRCRHGGRLAARIVVEIEHLGPGARLFQHRRLRLAHLTSAVDEAPGHGLLGEVGAGFQHRAQRGGILFAVGGGGLQFGVVDRGHPGQLSLAVGRRIVVEQVAVDGVLVFVALLVVRLDPVLVEGPLEEDVLVDQAGDLERGAGLHPEFVGGGAQHVGGGHRAGGIEPLAVGVDRLAARAETQDRQTHLVRQSGFDAALRQADQQAADPVILFGPTQALQDRHGRRARVSQAGKRALRGLIGKSFTQVQLEHGVRRRWRRAGGAGQNGDQHEGHANQENDQAGEHARRRDQKLLHVAAFIPEASAIPGGNISGSRTQLDGRKGRVGGVAASRSLSTL